MAATPSAKRPLSARWASPPTSPTARATSWASGNSPGEPAPTSKQGSSLRLSPRAPTGGWRPTGAHDRSGAKRSEDRGLSGDRTRLKTLSCHPESRLAAMSEDRAPDLHMLNVVVHDMAATLEFYRRLGVEGTGDVDPAGVHAQLRMPGGFSLELDTAESVAVW